MAVDTAQKRFSMLDFADGRSTMLFEADGSVDVDDKFHLLGLYSGITAVVIVPTPGHELNCPDNRAHWSANSNHLHWNAPKTDRLHWESLEDD